MLSRNIRICSGVASAGSMIVAGSPAARVATNRITMKMTRVTNACSTRPAMYLMAASPDRRSAFTPARHALFHLLAPDAVSVVDLGGAPQPRRHGGPVG